MKKPKAAWRKVPLDEVRRLGLGVLLPRLRRGPKTPKELLGSKPRRGEFSVRAFTLRQALALLENEGLVKYVDGLWYSEEDT